MRYRNATTKETNWDMLSELVKTACAGRTQKQFAKDANLSENYVSNIVNNKKHVVPAKEILQKIATGSHGTVSLSSLYEAAGYELDDYIQLSSTLPEKDCFDLVAQTLGTVLQQHKLLYGGINNFSYNHTENYDTFSYFLIYAPVCKWFFVSFHCLNSYYMNWDIVYHAITDILRTSSHDYRTTKISIITDDMGIYNHLCDANFDMFTCTLSVILVSFSSKSVTRETYLHLANMTEFDKNILYNWYTLINTTHIQTVGSITLINPESKYIYFLDDECKYLFSVFINQTTIPDFVVATSDDNIDLCHTRIETLIAEEISHRPLLKEKWLSYCNSIAEEDNSYDSEEDPILRSVLSDTDEPLPESPRSKGAFEFHELYLYEHSLGLQTAHVEGSIILDVALPHAIRSVHLLPVRRKFLHNISCVTSASENDDVNFAPNEIVQLV